MCDKESQRSAIVDVFDFGAENTDKAHSVMRQQRKPSTSIIAPNYARGKMGQFAQPPSGRLSYNSHNAQSDVLERTHVLDKPKWGVPSTQPSPHTPGRTQHRKMPEAENSSRQSGFKRPQVPSRNSAQRALKRKSKVETGTENKPTQKRKPHTESLLTVQTQSEEPGHPDWLVNPPNMENFDEVVSAVLDKLDETRHMDPNEIRTNSN